MPAGPGSGDDVQAVASKRSSTDGQNQNCEPNPKKIRKSDKSGKENSGNSDSKNLRSVASGNGSSSSVVGGKSVSKKSKKSKKTAETETNEKAIQNLTGSLSENLNAAAVATKISGSTLPEVENQNLNYDNNVNGDSEDKITKENANGNGSSSSVAGWKPVSKKSKKSKKTAETETNEKAIQNPNGSLSENLNAASVATKISGATLPEVENLNLNYDNNVNGDSEDKITKENVELSKTRPERIAAKHGHNFRKNEFIEFVYQELREKGRINPLPLNRDEPDGASGVPETVTDWSQRARKQPLAKLSQAYDQQLRPAEGPGGYEEKGFPKRETNSSGWVWSATLPADQLEALAEHVRVFFFKQPAEKTGYLYKPPKPVKEKREVKIQKRVVGPPKLLKEEELASERNDNEVMAVYPAKYYCHLGTDHDGVSHREVVYQLKRGFSVGSSAKMEETSARLPHQVVQGVDSVTKDVLEEYSGDKLGKLVRREVDASKLLDELTDRLRLLEKEQLFQKIVDPDERETWVDLVKDRELKKQKSRRLLRRIEKEPATYNFIFARDSGVSSLGSDPDSAKPNRDIFEFYQKLTGLPFLEEIDNPRGVNESKMDYSQRVLSRMKDLDGKPVIVIEDASRPGTTKAVSSSVENPVRLVTVAPVQNQNTQLLLNQNEQAPNQNIENPAKKSISNLVARLLPKIQGGTSWLSKYSENALNDEWEKAQAILNDNREELFFLQDLGRKHYHENQNKKKAEQNNDQKRAVRPETVLDNLPRLLVICENNRSLDVGEWYNKHFPALCSQVDIFFGANSNNDTVGYKSKFAVWSEIMSRTEEDVKRLSLAVQTAATSSNLVIATSSLVLDLVSANAANKPIPRYIDDSEGVIQAMTLEASKMALKRGRDFELLCYQPHEAEFDCYTKKKLELGEICQLAHNGNLEGLVKQRKGKE